jgi:CheY-like chemotaxis protein
VVEDNEEYCGTLVDMLEEQGYAVVATGDGIRALALLNRQTFDLILMDYQLPGMDGIETIRLAAQAHGANLPPVIMLTGFGTKGLVNASLEAGAVDYVIKPVRAEFLFQKIARHLAGPVSAVVVPPDGGTGE